MYPFAKIERKWQKKWLQKKIYEPDLKRAKKPFYNLMMFPYPSGEGLHVGHAYAFSGADIYGRYKRMLGYDVFQPIGYDSFGIHAENYALKINQHPKELTQKTTKRYEVQLKSMGIGYAWDEKLMTSNESYYKWTQWIFVQMFKHGLAYRKKSPVNWCLSCKTVLADEQVIDGKCERCSNVVQRKELEQWFFRITKYADKLLGNLDKIDWSEKVKIAQRNWIGKSEGALIKFPIFKSQFSIEVFTTRPDTLFGATYVVLSPEHEIISNLKSQISNFEEVQNYIKKAKAKSEEERIVEGKEKTGVELKGIKAINPANKEKISVWVADYVLGHVGTSAIMAVPAHDERDFDFAKKFNLPIKQVIAPYFKTTEGKDAVRGNKPTIKRKTAYAFLFDPKDKRYLCLDWGKFDWHSGIIGGLEEGEDYIEAAKREIQEETGYKDIKFVKYISGEIHNYFFAVHKNVNRYAIGKGMLFEIVSDKRTEINPENLKNHKPVWIESEKMSEWFNLPNFKYMWQMLSIDQECFIGDGIVINSGKFDGMPSERAKDGITHFVDGTKKVQYRLRDWLISRQRYWGPPIPLVFCENCADKIKNQKSKIKNNEFSQGELENPGWITVLENDLPVKLPYVKNFRPTGTDKSPLASVKKFYKVRCPKCRAWARRETDVSDTFLDSAWYYLRYPSVRMQNSKIKIQNDKSKSKIIEIPWNQKVTKKWTPVDIYIGGAEHAVLHLLYVRFLAMAFRDLKLVHFEEPFPKFRAHGLIIKDGAKMSKSKGNVVNPDEYIKNFGADALRMYLMFLGPYENGGDFRDTGIRGTTRFLKRVWDFGQANKFAKAKNEFLEKMIHKTVKKVTDDIENLGYNTAISAIMILMNEFEGNSEGISKEQFKTFLKLLSPFAPYIVEELWEILGGKNSIHKEKWPKYEASFAKEDTFELLIQVDGKLRAKTMVSIGISEGKAKDIAFTNEAVMKYIADKGIKKIIFVPNRIINIVT